MDSIEVSGQSASLRHKRTSGKELLELTALLRTVFKENQIKIPPNSELEQIISASEQFGNAVEFGEDLKAWGVEKYVDVVQKVLNFQITASTIKWARNKPGLRFHLSRLLKGTVDPTTRSRTIAKDFLFELQMLGLFESAGLSAELKEPDLVVTLDDQQIAVACKNLHLPENIDNLDRSIENQLHKARSQVRKSGFHGMVAVATQNVVSHRDLFVAPTEDDFAARIGSLNDGFLRRYKRIIDSKLEDRKVFGLILLLTTLTRIDDIAYFASAQFLTINNRCSEASPYFQVLKKLESKLLDRIM